MVRKKCSGSVSGAFYICARINEKNNTEYQKGVSNGDAICHRNQDRHVERSGIPNEAANGLRPLRDRIDVLLGLFLRLPGATGMLLPPLSALHLCARTEA